MAPRRIAAQVISNFSALALCTIIRPRTVADPPKYSYSPDHAMIGTIEAGERFEVESVEGFSNYFRSASDFSPERYALAEAVKWAVTGP